MPWVGGDPADGGGVEPGHDHGAVRSALDQGAALGQCLGQVGLLEGRTRTLGAVCR